MTCRHTHTQQPLVVALSHHTVVSILICFHGLVSVIIYSSCKVTFDLSYMSHLRDKGEHVKHHYKFQKKINVLFCRLLL